MFERYSEKARRAIFFARLECSSYGSPTIESEHLLLGLLRETALLQRLLKGRESVEVIRKEIEPQIIRRPRIPPSAEIPLSMESKNILDHTSEEAGRLGHGRVEPEHMLLGLLREDKCFGGRILQAHEITLSRVREELTRDGLV
jgi:ATP-dependent Clp protease ATP-binding subunit ClpC